MRDTGIKCYGFQGGGDCCERLKKVGVTETVGKICQMDRISIDGDVGDGERNILCHFSEVPLELM